ncbi:MULTISPECIES: beta-ketoacyl synthase N-terminal-like domain-containing protein [Pantoea]|uniref:Beta-ketoacyl synthase n=1 Tax=Pantoea phytobeneficialis TaxID=2052056 RepID=A0AAP9KP33_9GAMM|nr:MULTISPECIES: beta-ketoacyl synthase N-terminal-like domain-containing protein [Pantoea]MDO6406137.1 beta-ketoacyl synthase N-terminal-like domain-containing protein [Pantoea phytobeneficialis]QGR06551.1 beta-ketoacyl synthase [Pantoea phytobeneficialis]
MDNSTIISGYSARLAFAENSKELIEKLRQGKCAAKTNWFATQQAAMRCGIKENKSVARLASNPLSLTEQLCQLIEQALEHAMLDTHCLSGDNVRVYLTGLGPRVDVIDYKTFYDHNDIEDVTLNKSITHLHVAEICQDKLAHEIAKKYRLKFSPPNLQCTSNSSLAAVHLAIQAIASGDIDLVVVVNSSQITTQDIAFLAGQSMLESEEAQPFGEASKSVLFAEGQSGIVLESVRHRHARGLTGGVRLTSDYAQITSGRGNDAGQLSVNLMKVMNKVMEQAGIRYEQLCAILPHGNGSEGTDKAEAQALATLLAEHALPVLAYKGQIGYNPTGSGIIDLIIGHYSLCSGELISPTGKSVIRENMVQHVWLNKGTVKHNKHHLLKTGLGVDGSIIALVMSMCDMDA